MSKDNKATTVGKEGTVRLICGTVIAVAIIIAIVVIVFAILSNNADDKEGGVEPNVPKRNVVTMDNVHEIVEEEVKKAEEDSVAPGYYEVTMNTTWDFADGVSASENAYVENSASNTNDVYFDIVLAGTEEKIYSSPVLPVGSYINNIALDKQLDAGTYDCVIIYTLIDGEQNPLSNVQVSLTIVVNG